MCQHQSQQRSGIIGGLSSQQVIQRAAQAIDIRPLIDHGRIERLFWRHIIGGPQNASSLRQRKTPGSLVGRPPGESRQPQICHLHNAIRGQHQIGRFDVAVDDGLGMRNFQPGCRLSDIVHRRRGRQWPKFLDFRSQVPAIHIFHDQKVPGLAFVGIIGHHDVGMSQLGNCLDFALKSLDEGVLAGNLRRQQLHRDDPFHPAMASLEHGPHSPGP